MGIAFRIFKAAYETGVWSLWGKVNPSRLTVLNYHRIADPTGPDAFFTPNISATPEMFSSQMDHLQQYYKVISLADLNRAIYNGKPLPPNAALITFDDGYLDNYQYAFPELKKRSFPAVIFLATGFIGNSSPFYWDLIADVFSKTKLNNFSDPALGELAWAGEREAAKTTKQVVEALKKLDEKSKRQTIERLVNELGGGGYAPDFSHLFMSWDQARELANNGIEMGAHTVQHPILTRVSLDQARDEIMGSRDRIQDELGRPVTGFAYPNGQPGDFNEEIIQVVREAEFKTAFTLLPGPTSYRTARKHNYEIRRVFLSHKDSMARFAAKLNGVPRLQQALGRG